MLTKLQKHVTEAKVALSEFKTNVKVFVSDKKFRKKALINLLADKNRLRAYGLYAMEFAITADTLFNHFTGDMSTLEWQLRNWTGNSLNGIASTFLSTGNKSKPAKRSFVFPLLVNVSGSCVSIFIVGAPPEAVLPGFIINYIASAVGRKIIKREHEQTQTKDRVKNQKLSKPISNLAPECDTLFSKAIKSLATTSFSVQSSQPDFPPHTACIWGDTKRLLAEPENSWLYEKEHLATVTQIMKYVEHKQTDEGHQFLTKSINDMRIKFEQDLGVEGANKKLSALKNLMHLHNGRRVWQTRSIT